MATLTFLNLTNIFDPYIILLTLSILFLRLLMERHSKKCMKMPGIIDKRPESFGTAVPKSTPRFQYLERFLRLSRHNMALSTHVTCRLSISIILHLPRHSQHNHKLSPQTTRRRDLIDFFVQIKSQNWFHVKNWVDWEALVFLGCN